MTEELKLRVTTLERVEKTLEDEGNLEERKEVKDTYFKTDCEEVLKIREDGSGSYLIRYRPTEEGFEKVGEEKLEDLEKAKEQLESEKGVKAVLDKEMAFYSWKEFTVIVNRIKNVGDFLIVEGTEQPDKDMIEQELKLENPDHIQVPFSDLKQQ